MKDNPKGLHQRRLLCCVWQMRWPTRQPMSAVSCMRNCAGIFSEEQLIEFAATAARENFRARYNRVFDIGSNGLYRKGLPFVQSDAPKESRC